MTELRWGAATDKGQVRSINQDTFLTVDNLFAVADGMGGHAGGEVAAQVAVEALAEHMDPSVDGLVRAVRFANRAVWARAEDDASLRGMGTTMCALALVPLERQPESDDERATESGDLLVLANVGDSRAYLFQGGELVQLTDDHSLVEDLVREGRITAEEARNHPQRNIVTRVLGNDVDVEVDSWQVQPRAGDRYLLCSDGLFNEVEEDRIAAVLRRLDDPNEAAQELVRMANAAGGRDNITVVVVDIVDDGGRAEAASAVVSAEAEAPPRERTGRGTVTTGATPPPPGAEAAPAVPAEHAVADRPRRVTWRVLVFLIAVLAVLGAAGASVAWYARSTYHVVVDDERGEVVINRGRAGGVLWFQPTLEEPTGLPADAVPPARRDDVVAGKQQPSLADARRFVENLRAEAERLGLLDDPDDGTDDKTADRTGPAEPTGTTTTTLARTTTTGQP